MESSPKGVGALGTKKAAASVTAPKSGEASRQINAVERRGMGGT